MQARLHVAVSQLGTRTKLERGKEGVGITGGKDFQVVYIPFTLLEHCVEGLVTDLE